MGKIEMFSNYESEPPTFHNHVSFCYSSAEMMLVRSGSAAGPRPSEIMCGDVHGADY